MKNKRILKIVLISVLIVINLFLFGYINSNKINHNIYDTRAKNIELSSRRNYSIITYKVDNRPVRCILYEGVNKNAKIYYSSKTHELCSQEIIDPYHIIKPILILETIIVICFLVSIYRVIKEEKNKKEIEYIK